MITIAETRELTLYLVDADGMPVRAATTQDIAQARAEMRVELFLSHEKIADLESRVESLKAAVRRVAAERDIYLLRAKEYESRPLSPEVAEVVEAARRWIRAEAASYEEDDAVREIHSALSALPSPLPVVVTCGECQHLRCDCDNKEYCLEGKGYVVPNGFCHLGKRREL